MRFAHLCPCRSFCPDSPFPSPPNEISLISQAHAHLLREALTHVSFPDTRNEPFPPSWGGSVRDKHGLIPSRYPGIWLNAWAPTPLGEMSWESGAWGSEFEFLLYHSKAVWLGPPWVSMSPSIKRRRWWSPGRVLMKIKLISARKAPSTMPSTY